MTDERRRRAPWGRLALFVLLLVGLFVVGQTRGFPDAADLRARVEGAGPAGVAVFVGGYAVLTLLPAPKAVLTVLGGVLYGLVPGAAAAWSGALIGSLVAFGIGRLLGRDAVDRMLRGRLHRVDQLLGEHGLGAVVAVRLVPVIPFTAINYGASLTGVRFRHYALGTAVGMVPGSLAYAALGAWGTSPWGILAGVTALVLLVLVGGVVGRRLLARHDGTP